MHLPKVEYLNVAECYRVVRCDCLDVGSMPTGSIKFTFLYLVNLFIEYRERTKIKMDKEETQNYLKLTIIYLTAVVNASAIGWGLFLTAYKLHLYFNLPFPSTNALVLIITGLTVYISNRLKLEFQVSELSLKKQVTTLLSRTFFSVLAFTFALNLDVALKIFDFTQKFFADIMGV